jgi:predicted translin family RNA/ssDNA-binding protein
MSNDILLIQEKLQEQKQEIEKINKLIREILIHKEKEIRRMHK